MAGKQRAARERREQGVFRALDRAAARDDRRHECYRRDAGTRWVATLPVAHYADAAAWIEPLRALGARAYVGQMERGERTGYEHWQIAFETVSDHSRQALAAALPHGYVALSRSWPKAVAYAQKARTRIDDAHVVASDASMLTKANRRIAIVS